MKKARILVLCIISILIVNMAYAQTDSSEVKMSFDFGITRSRNINVFPLFKIAQSEHKKTLQVLYPLFSKTDNYHLEKKHLHVFPIYYKDSNENYLHQRYLSLYYPSLFHYKQSNKTQSKYYKFIELAPYISLFGISKSNQGISVENNFFFFISYNKNEELNKTRLTVFPAYWYYSNAKDTTHIIPGLLYSKRDRNYKKLNLGLLYNYNRTNNLVQNTLFPIYWQKKRFLRDDTISTKLLFPIYYSKKQANYSSQLLFPLIYNKQSDNYSSFSLFPLFSIGNSKIEDKNYFAITPIFWHFKDEDERINYLFPIFKSFKDDSESYTYLHPFIYCGKDASYQSFTLLPLFSFGHSSNNKKKHLAISPLYWQLSNKNRSSHTLFPVFWQNKKIIDSDTINSTCLFPLYWSKKSNEENRKFIFPLIHSYTNKDKKSLTVLPLFSYGKNLNNKYTYIYPFIYSIRNESYQSFTFFPLLSFGHASNNKSKHLAISPLYWQLSDKEKSSTTLFPIYWQKKRYIASDTIKSSCIFPLYWSYKNKNASKTMFLPILYNFKNDSNKSFTFFPLYSSGINLINKNQYLALTPLFYHKKKFINANDSVIYNTLFPLLWAKKSNEGNRILLFPILHSYSNKNNKALTVFPLFSYGKNLNNKYLSIAPLYLNQNYIGSKNDTTRFKMIFPIYWSVKQKDINNKIIFPLIYSLKNEQYKSFNFIPLFSYGKNCTDTKSHLIISPLYYNTKELIHNDTIKKNVLFPIYWSKHSESSNYNVLFPLIYKFKNDRYQSFSFVPLLSYKKNSTGTKSQLIISPLFYHTKELINNDTIKKNVLFPIYWSKVSASSRYNFLLPVIFKQKDENYQSFTIFPLFHKGKTPNDTLRRLAITPIYWDIRKKTPTDTIRTIKLFPLINSHKTSFYSEFNMPFIYSQKKIFDGSLSKYRIATLFSHEKTVANNDTSTRNVLFPLLWTYNSNEKQSSVLFPIWYKFSNARYSSTTLLPLFAYGKAKDLSRKFKMITPIYWSFKNETDSTNLLFPFYVRHKDKERKTTAILPFVIHSKSTDERNKYTNILLLYHAKWNINAWNDTISSRTLFPIYFARKSKAKNNKILLPLLYKLENKNYKSFTLFPLFSIGKSKTSQKGYLGITPLFWRTYNSEGSKHLLFPIYSYSKNESQSKFSFLLFLLRNEKKENYSKTSFLWPICEGLKADNKKSFRFAPILWYAKTDSSIMSSVQPIYYHYHDNKKLRFDFMWQVYNYKKKQDVSVSNSILWRLAKWENYSNGDFDKVFFYFLYQNNKLNDSKEFCIYPLYHTTADTNGDRTKSVFMSFYNYSKQYIPEIKESYEEERIFWVIRLRSNYNKLKSEGKEKYLIKKKK